MHAKLQSDFLMWPCDFRLFFAYTTHTNNSTSTSTKSRTPKRICSSTRTKWGMPLERYAWVLTFFGDPKLTIVMLCSVQVTGKYSVWLPDGRLMTVEYNVEKESGFVPKITFADNANPLSG